MSNALGQMIQSFIFQAHYSLITNQLSFFIPTVSFFFYFFTYLFSARGPTSAPYTLPRASAATPSAALVDGAFSTGSGMKDFTEPSLALPMRMPRFQPS